MRRLLILGAVVLMPTLAFCNGAMSLALSVSPWPYWLAYVLATVLFEALALGWWLNCPVKRALLTSIVANLVTGILGGFISGILGYGFLGVVGSAVNPDPFGQIVTMLIAFGLGSAIVEASVWRSSFSTKGEFRPYGPVLAGSLAVHMLGVPLALSILLIPERPYPGLEAQVVWHRGTIGSPWNNQMRSAFERFLAEHQRLPVAQNYLECLKRLRPHVDSVWPMAARAWNGQEWWTLCYVPDYARFDRTEMKRNPIRWNVALSGMAANQIKKPEWLTRLTTRSGWTDGLAVVPLPGSEDVRVERIWGETKEEFEGKVAALKP